MIFEIAPEWVHVQYSEAAQFTEVYGFVGSQGMVNLEGVRFVPKGKPSKTLAVFMHPASTLQLLPVPQALAKAGVHVLCAGSRFAKNDTLSIFQVTRNPGWLLPYVSCAMVFVGLLIHFLMKFKLEEAPA